MLILNVKKAAVILAGGFAVAAMATTIWGSQLTALFLCAAMLACLGIMGIIQRRQMRYLARYNGVSIFYLQEGHYTWSSHVGGYPPHFWADLLPRLLGKRPRGIKLLGEKADRDKVNRLALLAFETMLDELSAQPGAVLISASALNFLDRQPERLADRVRAIEQRPQWRYRVIHRQLNPIDTLTGRWLYAWPIRPGERYWRATAPGIIAWRAQDPVPVLTAGMPGWSISSSKLTMPR
ncbi:hypothetical protein [Pollutimonas bauzanensis]|uniref:hypothetical protein n=1 Tax=Pollutimonas bauzanensis TaxID=658167 RepID=UPI001160717D|nr:hypothetical protein [Pollutimonas bauzanensis]